MRTAITAIQAPGRHTGSVDSEAWCVPFVRLAPALLYRIVQGLTLGSRKNSESYDRIASSSAIRQIGICACIA